MIAGKTAGRSGLQIERKIGRRDGIVTDVAMACVVVVAALVIVDFMEGSQPAVGQ